MCIAQYLIHVIKIIELMGIIINLSSEHNLEEIMIMLGMRFFRGEKIFV